MAHSHVEANRQYFDELAANYDSKPWQEKMQSQIADELTVSLDFIGVDWIQGAEDKRAVSLLDYACGTGLVSKVLAPSVSSVVGIDISANMVAAYNTMASSHPFLRDKAHAIVGDLLTVDPSSTVSSVPDVDEFDIVAVGLGFHHFEDPVLATKRLAERVKAGGVVLIIDFSDQDFRVRHDAAFPKHAAHTVKTHGFSETRMKDIFEAAGLSKPAYRLMPGEVRMGDENPVIRKVFLGRAEKPALE